MKFSSISLVFILLVVSPLSLFAETKFPMGNGIDKWGIPLKIPDSELSLRLGGRFQSLTSLTTTQDVDADRESTSQDFQARRVRLQFQADLGKRMSFVMDLRNDNANQEDEGEKAFNVGDAFMHIPLKEGSSHAVRLFRAKVDVSRSQTVSSSELLFLNRASVADEAAQFVSHNRRATNAQLIGTFWNKVSYQVVLGDGVFSKKFKDAKGEAVDEITKQNFMLGAKVRISPFAGWEDFKPTETYFGTEKHFSFGVGAFNTSNINFDAGGNTGKVSRNLLNAEMSAHYQEWSIMAEYFNMDGVIEDHSVTNFNVGRSEGWYVQAEKVFSDFHFLAPFIRYETWDRFLGAGDYESITNMYGVNWYLNGNRFRVSAAYETSNLGRSINGSKLEEDKIHISSMWHF